MIAGALTLLGGSLATLGVAAVQSPAAPATDSVAANPPGQYLLDDGSSENSLGLTAGGELAWIHMFRVTAGNETITSVMTAFGTPTFPGGTPPPGTPFRVYVWRDPNQDGIPNDVQVLSHGAGVLANPDTDTFVKVPVASTPIGPVGTWFGIGVSLNHEPGQFPAPFDYDSGPYCRYAWVAGSTTPGGFDPNNVGAGIGVFNMCRLSFPGVWLLRANAVPEPATMSLLAVAGLALLRRRG